MKQIMTTAFLAATLALPAAAQTAPRPTFWVTVGAGKAFFGTRNALGAHVSVTYQFGASAVSVRSSGTYDFIETLFASPGEIVGASDWGVLYGRSTPRGRLRGSLAAGIGMARVYRGGFSAAATTTTHFGVPLETQLFFRVSGVWGLGLYGYGNLNSDQSFWGLSAAVELGRLR